MNNRYNVRICGKRYKNKTVSQVLDLVERYVTELDCFAVASIDHIQRSILTIKPNVYRTRYFDHNGKVIFSINKCK